jgi:hypothetical protein
MAVFVYDKGDGGKPKTYTGEIITETPTHLIIRNNADGVPRNFVKSKLVSRSDQPPAEKPKDG